MSDSQYRPRKRYDKEAPAYRRLVNRMRRSRNNQRVRQGLEPLRFPGRTYHEPT